MKRPVVSANALTWNPPSHATAADSSVRTLVVPAAIRAAFPAGLVDQLRALRADQAPFRVDFCSSICSSVPGRRGQSDVQENVGENHAVFAQFVHDLVSKMQAGRGAAADPPLPPRRLIAVRVFERDMNIGGSGISPNSFSRGADRLVN